MTPSLTIPTDNIYKFSCLFGLALILVSIFSFASNYTTTLDRKVRYSELVIGLESKAQRNKSEDDLLALNKKLREIAMENEKVLNLLLGAVIAIGSILSLYGADRWHKKIQQRDDKIVELQIEKLQIEIANLRRSNQNSSRS
ncbi:hypothetical protein [Polaromonas naphthalenivorans]|uniref:Transmembrane protein n=1 Tax=Polaromonas naphthalenivorans (strain CJ2) TaxID=365044 RepID=A1VU95_POLNA|nr:hypothetical protein [Polaromonas naphthalenivorans]ABM39223.1 hypothetical protein Pnap_3927 [Polaromonas naphthalenivorans CJ2]